MNINELKKQIRSEFEKEFPASHSYAEVELENYLPDETTQGNIQAFLDKVIERTWNEARKEIDKPINGTNDNLLGWIETYKATLYVDDKWKLDHIEDIVKRFISQFKSSTSKE